MRKARLVVLLAGTLILAACGDAVVEPAPEAEPATAEETGSPTEDATASTLAAPSTTTTTAPSTTTTTAAPTTTTSSAPAGSQELDALLAAMESAPELTSARIEGSMEIVGMQVAGGEAPDGPIDVVLPFGATFDQTTGDSSFFMDMSGFAAAMGEDDLGLGAMFGSMEFRQIGDTAYLRFPLLTGMFGATTEWVSMPADESTGFTSDMEMVPSDPNEMFESYQDANATVEDLGPEEVNGVTATHYRIVFDTAALLEELSPSERAELEQNGPIPNGPLPMDVWLADAGYLVKLAMEIDGSLVEDSSGESFESMAIRYDLYDVDQPIAVEPPPASEVTALDESDLFGGFGS